MPRKRKEKRSKLREWIEVLISALIIALLIRTFVIEAFRIPTSSMEPTLLGDRFYRDLPSLSKNPLLRWLQLHTYLVGDHLFVCKFIYGIPIPFVDNHILEFHSPKRFDVIVFKNPREGRTFIKRVIGLPGEEIMIKNRKVYINGEPLDDRYAYYSDSYLRPYDNWQSPLIIPKDHYFVMGDNRNNSSDSRSWGFLPKDLIKGKALFIYWPPHRIGLIR
jgi:signal peptidase I